MTPVPVLPAGAAWYDTGSTVFRYAARADGRWWVLRLNDFPEHPLFTLFVDAAVVGDIDDLPAAWRLTPRAALPVLDAPDRAEMLRLMSGLGPYGAEAGTPCTGDWCTCSLLTDDYAARPSTSPGDSVEDTGSAPS
ncbi:hypothetical protein OG689_01830 [Kitasatospora sp. NBC_00240]|uniref:hypothetical protein n=1 Tax=Kitasatospora sp. NBC_00240 TaxID=2903567 RepID=UPI00225B3391|nr:hypothetical protein [Kitasatospora sp. NBC_00240]MCX5208066.1 hypothetical protein [Kitasatospora sp. NBC_00240]